MRNRRRVSRYLFGVAGKMSESGNPAALDIRVVNIGTHGCCAEGPPTLKVGDRRVLTINWRAAEIRLEAVVVWSDAQARLGLRFLAVRREDQARLQDLCSTLTILPAAPSPRQAA